MDTAIEAMLGTLSQSVSGIMNSDAENRQELLEKSFREFGVLLDTAVGEIAEETTEQAAQQFVEGGGEIFEPLYKGLGAVGEVADLMHHMNERITRIGQNEQDPISPEVAMLLQHTLGMGELALRSAVNEHVDLDEGEDSLGKGGRVVMIPNVEDPDNTDMDVAVRTDLPEALAKFATDPGQIQQSMFELGAQLLLDAGLPQDTLNKAFNEYDGDPLSKLSPSDGGPGAAGVQTAAGDPSVDPSQGSDPNAAAAGQDDPLTILARIAAMLMIQINHIQQIVNGGSPGMGDPNAGGDPNAVADPNADPAADPNADPASDAAVDPVTAPAGPGGAAGASPQKKPPFGKTGENEGLEKVASSGNELALEKTVALLQEKLNRMERQPQQAKGIANPAVSLAKGHDTGMDSGADDEMRKIAARIEMLPPGRRDDALAEELIKMQLRRPLPG